MDRASPPTPLSSLLQTRIGDGIPPAQALADLLLALAPLQPGQDLAALNRLGAFNQALGELALASLDDASILPGLSADERRRQIWQGLVTLLPNSASTLPTAPSCRACRPDSPPSCCSSSQEP